MRAPPAEALELAGATAPRLRLVPPGIVGSAGEEAIAIARLAGLDLDPWQQAAVIDLLAERAPGRWATLEGGLVVPRQNGKGGVVEAIVLACLFVLRTPLVVYSAHVVDSALEVFNRVVELIEDTPELAVRVAKISRTNGREGITLKRAYGGCRLRIIARSKAGGRGFSADVVLLDEAMILDRRAISALMPTLSARPNPLMLAFSSAALTESSYLQNLARRARRALEDGDPARLTYLDYSVDPDDYGGRDSPGWRAARRDPAVWAIANPALRHRVSVEVVEAELEAMDPDDFDRERLGVFDPPPVEDEDPPGPLAGDTFVARADPASEPRDSAVALVVEVATGGTAAAIGLGAMRADGRRHAELVDHRPGTGWIADRLEELLDRWPDAVLALDPAGPAVQLRSSRDDWHELTGKDTGEAFAEVLAGVRDDGVRWRAPEDLAPALMLAAEKGQAMVTADGVMRWSRKHSPVDISPMTALTFAGWAGEYLAASGDPLKAIY